MLIPTNLARLKAAGIHLATSLTIAGLLVLMVVKVWYPSRLFELANGKDIFLLLLGCDITLGPLLTLIIFNIKKSRAELARDIAIIAFVQLSAMVYGVSTLLDARPAFIVYNAGQFNVTLANELMSGPQATEANDSPPAAPWFGPQLVGTKFPEDREESNRLLFLSVDGRGDVFQIPKYFVPYDDVRRDVLARSKTAEQIAMQLHLSPQVIENLTAPYARHDSHVAILPLVVRHKVALAIVDNVRGDFLGVEEVPGQ
jgi:hypothetical protein